MPDRVLPGHVESRLAEALESGAPLRAPLPSQARYASLHAGAMPAPRWHVRALTVAVAIAGIVAVAFAAPPQQRSWIVQSVGSIAHSVGVPAAAASPSPDERESPDAAKSPEAHEGAAPAESPEPRQSAEPTGTSDGDHPEPSPTSGPTGGGSDGGHGGDSSPQPSPSNGE